MSLKKFIEKGKLDFREMYFTPDTGTAYSHSFVTSPEEFIAFAKADFFKADKSGLINSLTNAKRAIDCQVDCFVCSIGLNPEKLEKELGANGVASLSFGNSLANGPLKFRFIQALGIATPAIVGRMRRLRNLLEHEYRMPQRNIVSDAIGVADLFVQACRGKMNHTIDCFSFGSGKTKVRGQEMMAKDFYVHFNYKPSPHFDVYFRDHEWISKSGSGKSPSFKVKPRDDEFVPLLKLIWRSDFDKDMTEPIKSFLTELGFQIFPSRFQVRNGSDF